MDDGDARQPETTEPPPARRPDAARGARSDRGCRWRRSRLRTRDTAAPPGGDRGGRIMPRCLRRPMRSGSPRPMRARSAATRWRSRRQVRAEVDRAGPRVPGIRPLRGGGSGASAVARRRRSSRLGLALAILILGGLVVCARTLFRGFGEDSAPVPRAMRPRPTATPSRCGRGDSRLPNRSFRPAGRWSSPPPTRCGCASTMRTTRRCIWAP